MIRENNLNFTGNSLPPCSIPPSTTSPCQFKEKFGITPTEYARSVR